MKKTTKYSKTLPFNLYKFNWKILKKCNSHQSFSDDWLSTHNTVYNQYKMTKYIDVNINNQGQVSVQLYFINDFDTFFLWCTTTKVLRKCN